MEKHKTGISFSVIGFAALLIAVTAPTLEKYHAITVTRAGLKKVSVKDPPSKVKKFPVRKVRKVLRYL